MPDLDIARRLRSASNSEDQFITNLVLPDRLLHVQEGIDRLAINANQVIPAVDARPCELTALPRRRYLHPGLAVQQGLGLAPGLMDPMSAGGGAAAGPDAAHGAYTGTRVAVGPALQRRRLATGELATEPPLRKS